MSQHHKSPADDVQHAAENIADTARAEAQEATEEVKDRLAARAEAEARAVHRAADEFEGGTYAQQAADQLSDTLSHVAHAVRDADLSEVQADLAAFARRNPLVFFGGAAVLGFMAGRALKASERAEPRRVSDVDYTTPAGGPAPYTWETPR